MQQSRGARRGPILSRDVDTSAESIENASHQVQRAQTVREARVLRTLIGVKAQTQLLDATQSLKFSRVDETNHQLFLGAVVTQRNDVVDRIAVDSLSH